jgi:hypothetical protein
LSFLRAASNLGGALPQGRTFHANPRVFYPPFDGPEYTDEMVDELVRFYGERSLLEGTMTAVPVEIARGCPFRCYFCNEPAVKGPRVRYRNWSVVEAVREFFKYVGSTFLSSEHQHKRNWPGFLAEQRAHPARVPPAAFRQVGFPGRRRSQATFSAGVRQPRHEKKTPPSPFPLHSIPQAQAIGRNHSRNGLPTHRRYDPGR